MAVIFNGVLTKPFAFRNLKRVEILLGTVTSPFAMSKALERVQNALKADEQRHLNKAAKAGFGFTASLGSVTVPTSHLGPVVTGKPKFRHGI